VGEEFEEFGEFESYAFDTPFLRGQATGAADDGKRFAALDVVISLASRREDYGIWVGFRGG